MSVGASRERAIYLLVLAILGLSLAGCSADRETRNIGGGVQISGEELPERITAALSPAVVPTIPDLGAGVSTFEIKSSTEPSTSVRLTFPAPPGLTADQVPIVFTSSTEAGPWEPLETSTNAGLTEVTATTPHLSFFTTLLYPISGILGEAKKLFDDATSGIFTEPAPPSCEGGGDASGAPEVTGRQGDALAYCLGTSNSLPIVKVVNMRHYPLEVSHPGFDAMDHTRNSSEFAALARLGSGSVEQLLPGEGVTLKMTSPTGRIASEYGGLAQSLHQLEVGVKLAISILAKFKLGSGAADVIKVMDSLVGVGDCASALAHPTGGTIIAKCLGAQGLLKAFGAKAVFAAALLVVAPVIEYFRGAFESVPDLIRGGDNTKIGFSQRGAPTSPPATSPPPTRAPATQPPSTSYDGDHDYGDGITLDTKCRDFLTDHDSDARWDAAIRMTLDFEVDSPGNPLWGPNLDSACGSVPNLTIGQLFTKMVQNSGG